MSKEYDFEDLMEKQCWAHQECRPGLAVWAQKNLRLSLDECQFGSKFVALEVFDGEWIKISTINF